MVIKESTVALRIIFINYCRDMVGWTKPNISAPFWRFYWNDRGKNYMSLNSHEWELTPDHCFIIPADTPIAIRSEGSVNHFHIHFTLGYPYHAPHPGVYQLPAYPLTRTMIDQLRSQLTDTPQQGLHFEMLAHALVMQSLAQLPQITPAVTSHNARLEVLFEYAQHCNYQLNNNMLAQHCNMSTNAFIRWFSNETGQSPQQWMLQQRIDRSCELLAYSDISIDAIAEQCGFCDRHHFSKVFKKLRGTTAASFRSNALP
jgi:AraC-like DNA-binding protein